jgi:glycosyltransferase involved in cell wall biosynthesis
LAAALQGAGFDQKVVIRANAARAAALKSAGIGAVQLRFGGLFDFATGPALKRILAEFRPQIALTWMGRASHMLPNGPYRHIGRLGGYYDLKFFRRCHHLVCNTPDLVRYCTDAGWPATRVDYVPNFVSFRASAPEPRARWQTPSGQPLLLALGRLHPNKAFDVLLRALALTPGAWLWIAGEGDEQGRLEALARDLGVADRVRWLGWREDREALYAAADMVVLPSRSEPFGNVMLDAWAAARPLVAAAALGPGAYVRHEENGLLVAVDDPPALAAAMARLIADKGLRETLVAGGRRRLASEFTETAVVQAWRELFDKVAA